MNKPLVAPSILSADFNRLGDDVQMINRSAADWFHCDVMDGRFVPNISFGFPILKAVKKLSTKPLDVHLMIVEPEKYIDEFVKAGADVLTVHIEASIHLHRTVAALKKLGAKAGVALNPHTSIDLLDDVIADIDLVCVMSVNPGFGGQAFIENTYDKTKRLKDLIMRKRSNALIEIDGGVDTSNAAKLVQCGADVLVAGNAVFGAKNPEDAIATIKNAYTTVSV
ncbi:MAG TPA: ribulose-phosphate 3-epimerase [Chitinophagales bacterium]|nr:ribulose-phosphate 3-epimerase [Chitinophagales bacterium]